MRPRLKQKEKLPPHVVRQGSDKTWFVRRYFPLPETDSKGRIHYKQIKRRCYPQTDERAAEISEFIETEYRREQIDKTAPVTVKEFIADFLAAKKKSVERRTYEFYESLNGCHIAGTPLEHQILQDLTPKDLQRFFDSKDLSGKMCRHLHQFLSTAFKQGMKWEILSRNPAEGVLLPKLVRADQAVMTPEQARRFIKACRTNLDYVIFELALETSMRPQEYPALRWSDIDLKRHVVHVRRALAVNFRGGGYQIKDPKTELSKRSIQFSEELKGRLLLHRARLEAAIAELREELAKPVLLDHMKKKGKNYQDRLAHRTRVREILKNYEEYDLVFPSTIGTPLSRLNLNRREFKDVLKLAKLDPKKYSLKSLRHTSLTMLAEKLSPRLLQERAGHADITTTMKYYVHIHDATKAPAAAHMAAALY